MASGIAVDPGCVSSYNDMKLRKTWPWIVYSIDKDGKNIVVEQKGEKGQTYDDLKQILMKKKDEGCCCWALADIPISGVEGQADNKLALINWFPDSVGIKQKMIYTSSTQAFHKSLGPGFKPHQANDDDDVELSTVQQNLQKFK